MTPVDLDAMALLLGDPEVMAYYSHPKSRAEALAWIEWNQGLYRQRGFGLWIVERLTDAEFVGDCGLTPQSVDGVIEIELGYHVRRALQGRDYATEAAAACRDYARDALKVRRLIALTLAVAACRGDRQASNGAHSSVSSRGPDAVAVTLEPNPDSSIYPVAYVRISGAVEEHLLDPDAMNEYRGSPHREQMAAILAPLMR